MAQVCELKCRNEHSQILSKPETDSSHGTQEIISAQKSLDTCLSQCDTCAKGTEMHSWDFEPYDIWCQCPEGSSVQTINIGEPLSACEREETSGEVCDHLQNDFTGEKQESKYNECVQRNLNRGEAVKKANQACLEAQNQIENSNCTSSLNVNVNMSDFTNSGNSMEACRSLSKTAQRIIKNTANEISRCSGIISKESSRCPSSVTVPSAKGTTSPISVSRFLSFNKLANKARSNLKKQHRIHKDASDSFKERADQCIAAFKKDPNPSLDPYPDSNPGQPPDTQTSQDSRKTTNWSGLAQTAAQAFENLNGFGLEASIDGGELDSSSNAPNAASSPSFKQFNNNNGGLRESPYSRFNDEDGGGGFNGDGNPGDSIRNSQRTHGNKNPRNQASQAGLTAQRGHGGPSGANGGGFGSRNNGGGVSPSTNANQRGQARRRFASTKKRNLVLGYKRVKRGGSALTYHPTDLKKYGRDHVLTMARKAKKTFGEETPLLFENGEFIRDYLEMKNSLAWKKHNLRQRNRLSGIFKTKEEREKKAFHPCALVGECYTESRYNIFMLHHFAVIKFISDREE